MPFGKATWGAGPGPSETNVELRESLLAILKDVSPNEDNYFISNLEVAPPALQQLHEWNLFYEARATSAAGNIEGAATTYADLPLETRSNNRTVILDAPIRLSRTRASIANVTGEDALGKEKERALRRLKSKMEWATINGQAASGLSGVASGMAGIDQMISTNVTARSSGASFTETELNDIIQESWDAVGGEYVMDLLAAPAIIKRRISGFGTNLTRNVEAPDKRLTQEVRVYDSEIGQTIMILAHKDVRSAAGTLTVLGLREELFAHSFLVNSGEPHWEDRAKDGDRENGVYITEFTSVSFDQRASVKRTGYATTR
jgi:hypothetical protein